MKHANSTSETSPKPSQGPPRIERNECNSGSRARSLVHRQTCCWVWDHKRPKASALQPIFNTILEHGFSFAVYLCA